MQLVVVMLAALVVFSTCGRAEAPGPEPEVLEEIPSVSPPYSLKPAHTPKADPTPHPSPSPKPEREPGREPKAALPINPLTGMYVDTDLSTTRPLAIMINNNRESMPQLGVSMADIIYEIPVEGGMTRMMLLFSDVSDVGVIGSVRSSRHYYVDIVQSYDAIYIFAGGSTQAYTALSNKNITRIDGVNGSRQEIFYRDRYRASIMSYEHTLVTSGELITEHLPTYDYRLELEEGYERALKFATDGTPADGMPALDFKVSFSQSKTTSFTYDEDAGVYYLRQHGSPYVDGNDNTQVSATNVLILKTSVSPVPGDREGRLNVGTTGSNSGYFVCGGKYTEIVWSRENDSSQFAYALPDGGELALGRGKTYVCIIPQEYDVDFQND